MQGLYLRIDYLYNPQMVLIAKKINAGNIMWFLDKEDGVVLERANGYNYSGGFILENGGRVIIKDA